MSIASEFNPVGADFEGFYSSARRAREEQPVFFSEQLNAWVVTRYDDIIEMLGNPVFTVEGILSGFNYDPQTEAILSTGINWNETPHIAGAEGEDHLRLKKILQPVLAPKRLRAFEPEIRDLANKLIDRFIDRGHCEFIHEFCYLLPLLTMFRYIGFREDEYDLEQLSVWSTNTFKIWLTPMSVEEQLQCARDAVDYQNYFRAKVNERRKAPRDDLMTEMVNAMDSGEMDISEDELVLMFIFTFIGAAHETTMAQIGNTVHQLLSVRERWQALLDHPERAEAIVEETIRLDGSVVCWYRRVAEDVDFKGFHLKKGDFVLMAFGSGNHDESKFKDPEAYCPFRDKGPTLLTFSQGRHFCLGAPLARIEVRIALEELSRRLPGLRLQAPGDAVFFPSVATRALAKLNLEW